MPDLQINLLAEVERPLLNKFYRQHRSSMRAASEGQLWVARSSEIIAGMSLSPAAEGYWLTGLFVAPTSRGQGLASQLVGQAVQSVEGPVWLFCHPNLQALYRSMGFCSTTCLPHALNERLARYQRSKPLLAMAIDRPGSRP
ncbi:GNAT family N-acetyltransferase [Pseudomonas protegens]|uniref:GNAT family N-acetyltransferase n=1 Tax=Pseudomonas protegens TaxID=380021 RepID=UPI000317A6DD|nr:GNAT family N-acetyltransferase [Pseudomonas protegens]ROM22672.1 GNAT family N-acetyltransferase [Pseudomonas protegens]ROM42222.1 GNAT family N-acetyltransferase [Pseudomonas protegens]